MTLEEFRFQSTNQQVAHIDITSAPSYPLWYKAAKNFAKRQGGYHIESFLLSKPTLTALGFSMAYYPELKAAEYARQVCMELGLTPAVNRGKFKGTEWDAEELYIRLPQATE